MNDFAYWNIIYVQMFAINSKCEAVAINVFFFIVYDIIVLDYVYEPTFYVSMDTGLFSIALIKFGDFGINVTTFNLLFCCAMLTKKILIYFNNNNHDNVFRNRTS